MAVKMNEAVIVSIARTPIGKAHKGYFSKIHGSDLAAHAIKEELVRAGVEGAEVDDVLLGSAHPEGPPAII
jgi:acetyl-CoA C-acetyltransferase